MRKRLFQPALLVVLLELVITTLPALAANRYFSLNTGVWLPHQTSTFDANFQQVNISYSPGWSLGGTLGTAFDNGMRLENELTYRQAEAKGDKEDQWNLGWLVNIWWDGRNSTPITPYFGGGFGFGRAHVASPGLVDNSGGIAYQAGGGFVFSQNAFDFDLGYRYFGIADTTSNIGSTDLTGSSWVVGVRKKF